MMHICIHPVTDHKSGPSACYGESSVSLCDGQVHGVGLGREEHSG